MVVAVLEEEGEGGAWLRRGQDEYAAVVAEWVLVVSRRGRPGGCEGVKDSSAWMRGFLYLDTRCRTVLRWRGSWRLGKNRVGWTSKGIDGDGSTPKSWW